MFDSHDLYKKRLSAHMKESSRYLRYIFNGHIAFAMLFFIAVIAYHYQQWLAQLPDDFPTAVIMGIVLGLIVSYSPVRTLLKEPDLVFLIPAEQKMGAYFRNSILYSFAIQIYIVFLGLAVMGPLYFASFPDREGSTYLLTLIIVLVFKLWNLLANWWMLKIREKNIRYMDQVVRLLLNVAVFYFLIQGNIELAGITTILFVIIFINDFIQSRKHAGFAWELLVEKDRQRSQTFYRFANLFTDVPHLKTPVKRRHWLVSFINQRIPFRYKHTLDYLYRITFIRSGDYLGMYVRLIIIGGLFIYFIPNIWMKLAIALLFLYLSSFQMMTLYNHYRTIMWMDIYPITVDMRKKSLIKWLIQLIIIQTILFAGVFLLAQEYVGIIYIVAFGSIFNYLFINGYVKRKLV